MTNEENKPVGIIGLSEALRIPGPWLREQADKGNIPCLRIQGKKVLFNVAAVQNAINEMAAQKDKFPDVSSAEKDFMVFVEDQSIRVRYCFERENIKTFDDLRRKWKERFGWRNIGQQTIALIRKQAKEMNVLLTP